MIRTLYIQEAERVQTHRRKMWEAQDQGMNDVFRHFADGSIAIVHDGLQTLARVAEMHNYEVIVRATGEVVRP